MRLSEEDAKRLVHFDKRSRLEQLLILLATTETAVSVREITEVASRCGVRTVSKWNVSDILRKSNGLAILTESGWEITPRGEQQIAAIARVGLQHLAVKKTIADVRQHVGRISSRDAREFIEEAISCFEGGQFRAAVVFSWVGAVSVMYAYVTAHLLQTFNAEARRRDSRWKDARNADELGRMKEHDFLDVVEAIGAIGKNVKQTLQNQCLSMRNACGHPNSLKISENNVAAHLDTLVLNVYSKF